MRDDGQLHFFTGQPQPEAVETANDEVHAHALTTQGQSPAFSASNNSCSAA
jgi:hypothetical protein